MSALLSDKSFLHFFILNVFYVISLKCVIHTSILYYNRPTCSNTHLEVFNLSMWLKLSIRSVFIIEIKIASIQGKGFAMTVINKIQNKSH